MQSTNSYHSISHDLNDGKQRTTDVILDQKVKFESLLLRQEIHSGLRKNGFIYLSPIQKKALPLALTGCSIIVHGKSGTGKTLIFAISALYGLLLRKHCNLQCIILTPTREIAMQNAEVINKIGCDIKGFKLETFIGGISLDEDIKKSDGCQIAIGTPGRINHLIELAALTTNAVRLLVFDEVDQLLNDEFKPLVMKIVAKLPETKQVIFCSATLTDEISASIKKISHCKYVAPTGIAVNYNSSTPNVLIGLKHFVAPVSSDIVALGTVNKRKKLVEILHHMPFDQCFVFVNYLTQAKTVCNFLNNNGLYAIWISSKQEQSTRLEVIDSLKMNRCRILVTTDLTARGIDVYNANLVINMSIPYPSSSYLHRIGRAGRFGSFGTVVTIVFEGDELDRLKKLISSVITEPIDLYLLPLKLEKSISEYAPTECQVCTCVPRSNINIDDIHPLVRNHHINGIVKNNDTGDLKPTKSKNGKKKPQKKRKNPKNGVQQKVVNRKNAHAFDSSLKHLVIDKDNNNEVTHSSIIHQRHLNDMKNISIHSNDIHNDENDYIVDYEVVTQTKRINDVTNENCCDKNSVLINNEKNNYAESKSINGDELCTSDSEEIETEHIDKFEYIRNKISSLKLYSKKMNIFPDRFYNQFEEFLFGQGEKHNYDSNNQFIKNGDNNLLVRKIIKNNSTIADIDLNCSMPVLLEAVKDGIEKWRSKDFQNGDLSLFDVTKEIFKQIEGHVKLISDTTTDIKADSDISINFKTVRNLNNTSNSNGINLLKYDVPPGGISDVNFSNKFAHNKQHDTKISQWKTVLFSSLADNELSEESTDSEESTCSSSDSNVIVSNNTDDSNDSIDSNDDNIKIRQDNKNHKHHNSLLIKKYSNKENERDSSGSNCSSKSSTSNVQSLNINPRTRLNISPDLQISQNEVVNKSKNNVFHNLQFSRNKPRIQSPTRENRPTYLPKRLTGSSICENTQGSSTNAFQNWKNMWNRHISYIKYYADSMR